MIPVVLSMLAAPSFDGNFLGIAMAVGFVLAALFVARGLMRKTIFPAFDLKVWLISVVATTVLIWLVLNFEWLGWLAGIGMILLLVVPRIFKIGPFKLKLPF